MLLVVVAAGALAHGGACACRAEEFLRHEALLESLMPHEDMVETEIAPRAVW
jgi:hypothetical protein